MVPRAPDPSVGNSHHQYVNRNDVDPVSQGAIAHAQFEIIHPFADGNGRVGRVPIAWVLVRRVSLVTPPPALRESRAARAHRVEPAPGYWAAATSPFRRSEAWMNSSTRSNITSLTGRTWFMRPTI